MFFQLYFFQKEKFFKIVSADILDTDADTTVQILLESNHLTKRYPKIAGTIFAM